MRPVRTELEFHENSGHHANDEVDSQDSCPEASCLMVGFVVTAQREGLQDDNERRKTHGELWKEVVEGDRKGKMQAVNQECAIHFRSLAVSSKSSIMPRPFPGRCDVRHMRVMVALALVAIATLLFRAAKFATTSGILVPQPFLLAFWNHGWNHDAPPLAVDRNEGQMGGSNVL